MDYDHPGVRLVTPDDASLRFSEHAVLVAGGGAVVHGPWNWIEDTGCLL